MLGDIMIIGIGVDCVNKKSISGKDTIFIEHTFTELEQNEAKKHYDSIIYFAERFAVKEAVFKALNHFDKNYDDLRGVQTLTEISGKPITTFLDETLKKKYQIHVSITNEDDFAIAFVIIESKKGMK